MLQCKTKWKKKKLGDLGYTYSGLSNKTIDDFGSGEDFIPYMNIYKNSIIKTDKFEQVKVGLNERQNQVQCGDVFFTTSSETPDEVGLTSVLIDKIDKPLFLNSFCFGFRLNNNNEFDNKFLAYLLRGESIRSQISKMAQGSTRYNLSKTQLLDKLNLYYPEDKKEQQRIAGILLNCDKAIEKTEETIEKYKQIKAGMMQDLFTRGLDENGKLRPTYAQNPDLYKYSKELDRYIPKEWDVTTLLDCCTKPCSYGINAPAVDFDTNLPLYLRITDITEEGKYNQQGRKCVDSIDASKYILEPNDIVFARTGATVGKTYLYDIDDGQLVYAGFLICFSLDPSIVDPYFIKTYTETDYYLNWVTVYSQRSGQPGINGNEYSKMLLAKPQRKEQEKIGIVFKKIDEKINYENEYLNKYKQIKQGLMKRLLSPSADAEIVEE